MSSFVEQILMMNHHLRLIFQVQFLIKVFSHSVCVFWKKWKEARSSITPIAVSDIVSVGISSSTLHGD
jgi:hypothetical protein